MCSWRSITTMCAAAMTLAASAQAANVTVNGTVAAGTTLSVAANGTPSFTLTLNGTDQSASFTLPVSVIDARGLSTGGGWNLTVTSTQFSDGAGHAFPANASTITAVTSGCGASSTCTLPTNSIASTNLALPAAATAPTAIKYLNAANATGLGTTNVNASVAVAVPANVFAGTYSSTVTVSIVAGP
ncbi:MAG: WxL domain-containing protein [Gaiellaceae bacterium]